MADIKQEEDFTSDTFPDSAMGGEENGGFAQPAEGAEIQTTNADSAMDTQEQGGGDTVGDDGTNEDDRKLFVGGLSWETTTKDLKEFFSKFGTVLNCFLKTDVETKRSRGFGFVVFNRCDVVDSVLNTKDELKLHGKIIEPKRAKPRYGTRKIFVGRVDPECPEEDINKYFTDFGKVVKIDLPFDSAKEQRRAFVFVEFDTEEAVKKVLAQEKHLLNGQEVDVKKATQNQDKMRGGARGGRGGRGGGYQSWYGGYGPGYYGGGYHGGYYGGGYDQGYGYGNYGSWGGYDQGYGYGYGSGGYDYNSWYGGDQQQSSYGKSASSGGGNKRGRNNHYGMIT